METPWSTEMTPEAPAEPQQPPADSATKAQRLAKSQLDKQKDKLAQALDSTASALRQSSGTLEQEGQPALKQAAEMGAQKVQEVSQYLRQTDASELIQKARDVARQQPLLVAGAGFLLTLAAGRVVKVLMQEPQPEAPQAAEESTAPPPPEPMGPAPQLSEASPMPAPSEGAEASQPPPRRRTRRTPPATAAEEGADGASADLPQ